MSSIYGLPVPRISWSINLEHLGTVLNCRISALSSAIHDTSSVIVMFVMFVVDRLAAAPEGPITYRTMQGKFSAFVFDKNSTGITGGQADRQTDQPMNGL